MGIRRTGRSRATWTDSSSKQEVFVTLLQEDINIYKNQSSQNYDDIKQSWKTADKIHSTTHSTESAIMKMRRAPSYNATEIVSFFRL